VRWTVAAVGGIHDILSISFPFSNRPLVSPCSVSLAPVRRFLLVPEVQLNMKINRFKLNEKYRVHKNKVRRSVQYKYYQSINMNLHDKIVLKNDETN